MEPPVLVGQPSVSLALSFDSAASPSVTLKSLAPSPEAGRRHGYDAGVAWYPPEDTAAFVIRTPDALAESPLTPVLEDHERFESTVLAIQNVRYDLMRVRTSGVGGVVGNLTQATQAARALSRDVDHLIAAASEIKEATS